jgi:hypothetical protein
MKSSAEMHGDRAFAYPALLLSYRDDFRCQFFRSLTDRRILPREFLFSMISSRYRHELAVRPMVYAHKRAPPTATAKIAVAGAGGEFSASAGS